MKKIAPMNLIIQLLKISYKDKIFKAREKGHTHTHTRAKSLQSRLTFCDPTNCSPSGSLAHGILWARILEWVAISFSRVSA